MITFITNNIYEENIKLFLSLLVITEFDYY